MWSGFYVGKHGGIVSNNPLNPEAASMSVTDTRLVNMPEKTRFDVSSEFHFPALNPNGQVLQKLTAIGATLVFPEDISNIQKPDGSWNGNSPEYKYEKAGVIYNSFVDIPGASPGNSIIVTKGLLDYTSSDVKDALTDYTDGNQEVPVFQLDPNQLLTVSSWFKVIIRRPLKP